MTDGKERENTFSNWRCLWDFLLVCRSTQSHSLLWWIVTNHQAATFLVPPSVSLSTTKTKTEKININWPKKKEKKKVTLASSSNSSDRVWDIGLAKATTLFPLLASNSAVNSCSTTEERNWDIFLTVRLKRPSSWVVGRSNSAASSSAVLYCNPIPIRIALKGGENKIIVRSNLNNKNIYLPIGRLRSAYLPSCRGSRFCSLWAINPWWDGNRPYCENSIQVAWDRTGSCESLVLALINLVRISISLIETSCQIFNLILMWVSLTALLCKIASARAGLIFLNWKPRRDTKRRRKSDQNASSHFLWIRAGPSVCWWLNTFNMMQECSPVRSFGVCLSNKK